MKPEEIYLNFTKKYYRLLRELHISSHLTDMLEHFILSKVNVVTDNTCRFYFDPDMQKMHVTIIGVSIQHSHANEIVNYFKKEYQDDAAQYTYNILHDVVPVFTFKLDCEKVCDKLYAEFEKYLARLKTHSPEKLVPYQKQSKYSAADVAQQLLDDMQDLESKLSSISLSLRQPMT